MSRRGIGISSRLMPMGCGVVAVELHERSSTRGRWSSSGPVYPDLSHDSLSLQTRTIADHLT